jgi:hypothetical protein
MKTLHVLFAFSITLMLACSKDDEMRPLSASSGGFTFDSLNTCDIGSGSMATLFDFQIELDSVPTLDLGGVEFDLEWSNGDKSEDIFEDDFIISGSTIEYDWCFRFGNTDWFEVKPTIVDPNRNPLSNEVTIRVNKPAGAN